MWLSVYQSFNVIPSFRHRTKTSHLVSLSKDINKFDELDVFIKNHKIIKQYSKALNSLDLAIIETLPLKKIEETPLSFIEVNILQ